MPDTLAPSGADQHPSDIESRVAVLEQVARTAEAVIERLDRRLEAMDRERDLVRALLGLIIMEASALLYVTLHGFHWP